MKTAQFNALPKAKKKVLIAKDIIRQLKNKKYKAATGDYVKDIHSKFENLDALDIKKHFRNIRDCTVCALGACLLSATRFKNQLTFGALPAPGSNESKSWKLLKDIFTPTELLTIENCFEGYSGANRVGFSLGASMQNDIEGLFNRYHDKFNSNKRLIVIMQNIIRNKGKFIPEQDLKQ